MSKIDFFRFIDLPINTGIEKILKKIHFLRLKSEFLNEHIKYIEDIYIKNNDVRFFNELLWIVKNDLKIIPNALSKFNKNFKNSIYNHNYNPKLYDFSISYSKFRFSKISCRSKKIALIGNPIFFIIVYFKFLLNGINVDVINVKYHPNKFLNGIFYSNLFSFLYKFIFFKNYYEISVSDKLELPLIKLPKKYDVGFHKLSFIIKDNIISSFRNGLINDHWGMLPFLKGRSTLLYSRLLGVKPIITNHLIDKEIDTGQIICYSKLNLRFQKFQIIFGLSGRIFKSINLLCDGKFEKFNNKNGFVFFEMHPWLIKRLRK